MRPVGGGELANRCSYRHGQTRERLLKDHGGLDRRVADKVSFDKEVTSLLKHSTSSSSLFHRLIMADDPHTLALLEHTASLRELGRTVAAARFSQEEAEADPTSLASQGYPVLAILKSLNRTFYTSAKESKQVPLEKRAEMDRAFLQLQNMGYERNHLEREIRRCKEYECVPSLVAQYSLGSCYEDRSEYQNIPLHELDEFAAAQESDDVPTDPHELTLARLQFELSERKRSVSVNKGKTCG
jgi:THO complex subunit 5